MFCKNCGNQIPDGVAFCAACGTPVTAAPAAPAAPVAPVAPEAAYGYAAAAPAAPAAAPAGNAFVAFFTRRWAGIKAFVLSAKNALIKLIAIICAAVIVLGLMIALLAGSSAKSVAKKYIQASFDGDAKQMMSLMAGKMKQYYEKEYWDDEDDAFEELEDLADEYDIDADIDNFSQYYKVMKKVAKAEREEEYGKKAKLKLEIKEVDEMNSKELRTVKELYESSEDMEDYINPDKIKKGVIVTIHYYINGSEDSDTDDIDVVVVKYGGSWKVLDRYPAFIQY